MADDKRKRLARIRYYCKHSNYLPLLFLPLFLHGFHKCWPWARGAAMALDSRKSSCRNPCQIHSGRGKSLSGFPGLRIITYKVFPKKRPFRTMKTLLASTTGLVWISIDHVNAMKAWVVMRCWWLHKMMMEEMLLLVSRRTVGRQRMSSMCGRDCE